MDRGRQTCNKKEGKTGKKTEDTERTHKGEEIIIKSKS